MSHSDDKGLVLPPAVAPIHVIIVPFFKTNEDLTAIQEYIAPVRDALSNSKFSVDLEVKSWSRDLEVEFDIDDAKSPGWKFNEYELKGVPVRLTIGKKEMEQGLVELYRRDTGAKELIKLEEVADKVITTLYNIQSNLLENNKVMRKNNTVFVESYEEFQQALDDGKFVFAHWDGTAETEALIKEECKAVTRCIPLISEDYDNKDQIFQSGTCVKTGKPSSQRVLFARSY